MNDLGSALRELAGTSHAPGPVDAAELWGNGRARVRRRQLVTIAVAAAVVTVLVSLGTLVVVPPTAVVPADQVHAPALPKNIWAAPGWLPSTSEHGPPGTVAAIGVVGSERQDRRFVISATTGEYRLLDLPGFSDYNGEQLMALSPDGNHIAYWFIDEGRVNDQWIRPVGLAIYDTRTGTVKQWRAAPVDQGHLFPLSPRSLLWLDPMTLAIAVTSTATTNRGVPQHAIWRIDQAVPTPVAPDLEMIYRMAPSRDGRFLVGLDPRRYGYFTASGKVDRGTILTLPKPTDEFGYSHVITAGSTVVVIDQLNGDGEAVLTGRMSPDGVVSRLSRVGPDGAFPLGLVNDRTLLVLGPSEGGSLDDLFLVDLDQNGWTRLGNANGAGSANSGGLPTLQVATELVSQPMVEGVRPPTTDPRVVRAVVAAGVGGLVVLTCIFLWWRRRA